MDLRNLGHKIGLSLIDKCIILFALLIVIFSASSELGAVDVILVALVVFCAYLAVILTVEILTLKMVVQDSFTRAALGVLIAGFTMFLYPIALEIGLIILWLFTAQDYFIAADVRTVLLWTIVIRSFVRIYLGQRWRIGGKQ